MLTRKPEPPKAQWQQASRGVIIVNDMTFNVFLKKKVRLISRINLLFLSKSLVYFSGLCELLFSDFQNHAVPVFSSHL